MSYQLLMLIDSCSIHIPRRHLASLSDIHRVSATRNPSVSLYPIRSLNLCKRLSSQSTHFHADFDVYVMVRRRVSKMLLVPLF